MTPSLIAGCLWVVLATLVAFLPFRAQFPPGIALLLAAPVLMGWIAIDHGPWLTLGAVLAFGSMFRRPLIHLLRHVVRRFGEAAS